MALPPGPPLPGIAQTLAYSYFPLQLFDQCAARYGDPFTLRLSGFGDFVMLSAPEHIKQVFTGDPEEMMAGKANAVLAPLVGTNSVLLLDGKEHLRQRRLLLPPLHGERMQAYAGLMAELSSAAIDRMPLHASFSLHEYMQAITLQVILRAVFGLKEGAQMDQLAAALVEFMKPPPPLFVFLPPRYFRYLEGPWSPLQGFLRARAAVDRMLREIIRAQKSVAEPGRTDILSLLLQARDEDGRAMTEDELRDELITMLVAGHETTATALSWAFAFVLSHPAVYERLRQELLATRKSATTSLPAALAQSPYLDAVIKESLRLRPIVPDVVRYVPKPMRFAGYDLPGRVYLTPCIHLTHRRPDLWESPEQFKPERFLNAKVDPYTWYPFGGGIRRCLGMAFALYEMKIVLGLTMLRAHLRLSRPGPLKAVRRGVTLAPAGGTPVTLDFRDAI
jgi:cytochrome P450